MLYNDLREIAIKHGFAVYNPRCCHSASPDAVYFSSNNVEILIDYEWDEEKNPTEKAFLDICYNDEDIFNSTECKVSDNILIYIVSNASMLCEFIPEYESLSSSEKFNLLLSKMSNDEKAK